MKKIIFLILIFLLSCSVKEETKTPKKETSQINGPLLAQVEDWQIGLDDFNNSVKLVEESLKDKNIKIDRKVLLDEIVKNIILSYEAKRKGLDKDRDVIKAVEDYKNTLLAGRLINEITKDIYISDRDVEAFYNQNKEVFKGSAEFKVKELAVDTLSRAQEISSRLSQGEDFSSLARQYSVLPSSKDGGDLGFIKFDPTGPNKKFDKFWIMISNMEPGTISSPFKGDDGKYYIVKLEEKKGGEVIPLSKIKDELKKLLEEKKKKEKVDEFVNEIKNKFKIVINNNLLD